MFGLINAGRFATRIELANASASSGLTTWPPKRHGHSLSGSAPSATGTNSSEVAPAAAAAFSSGRNSSVSVAMTEVDAEEERLVMIHLIFFCPLPSGFFCIVFRILQDAQDPFSHPQRIVRDPSRFLKFFPRILKTLLGFLTILEDSQKNPKRIPKGFLTIQKILQGFRVVKPPKGSQRDPKRIPKGPRRILKRS